MNLLLRIIEVIVPTEEVVEIVRICAAYQTPVVA